MSPFLRYFLHFSGICLVITILFVILSFFDLPINRSMVITYLVCIVFFSTSMSLIFSNFIVKPVEMTFRSKNISQRELFIDEIKKMNTSNLNRKEEKIDENHIRFVGANKYSKWLTSPIYIEIADLDVIVEVPFAYLSRIKKLASQYSN